MFAVSRTGAIVRCSLANMCNVCPGHYAMICANIPHSPSPYDPRSSRGSIRVAIDSLYTYNGPANLRVESFLSLAASVADIEICNRFEFPDAYRRPGPSQTRTHPGRLWEVGSSRCGALAWPYTWRITSIARYVSWSLLARASAGAHGV